MTAKVIGLFCSGCLGAEEGLGAEENLGDGMREARTRASCRAETA